MAPFEDPHGRRRILHLGASHLLHDQLIAGWSCAPLDCEGKIPAAQLRMANRIRDG